MPTRMIREGLLDSERYWSVTIEAQRMFLHMLLLADDFGCISVSPIFLRRRCFNDSPSVERISKLLNELADVDLIRLYEVDRSCLALIPRFKQRVQRYTLKHSPPPDSLLGNDDWLREKFNSIKSVTQNPTVRQHPVQRPEEKRREEKRITTPRKTARKSSLPENWVPANQTVESLSAEFGLRVPEDIDRYVTAFRDACEAKNYQYADFDAAFRNCVRQDWPRLRGTTGKAKVAL